MEHGIYHSILVFLMAKITTPLTNTEVKQAKPKEKEYNLMDGGGLKLRIKPNASKHWLFNYQHPISKKRNNLSLGSYPAVTLAAAREAQRAAKELLARRIDPKEHRDDQRQQERLAHADNLETVTKAWFEIKKDSITPNYADDIWRSFEGHLFPKLGNTPISKLSAPKVISVLNPIAAKGSLETVKRLCQRLNEVMIWAVNTGRLQSNPIAGIRYNFKAPEKKNMPALRPEELPELLQTINRASIKQVTRCLIEWELHTLTRPSEAAGAKWSEIDELHKIWRIPAERMKKRRNHAVPLTKATLNLLEVMRPISGHSEFIFTADRNPRQHTNNQTANAALKRMGFKGRLVAHGLRTIGSTTLNEQGFERDLIEAALAHADKDSVRAAYNRAEYIERRRPMMEWWSQYIINAATQSASLANTSKKVAGLPHER